jgi:hypothetical protein
MCERGEWCPGFDGCEGGSYKLMTVLDKPLLELTDIHETSRVRPMKLNPKALEKSKNETTNAEMVGEKMKAAKEDSDAKIEAKAKY